MIRSPGALRSFALCAALALPALLAGCGGGGGADTPTPAPPPPDVPLALMVDSMGRQLPEAEFGRGDALAAGADGIAFDAAPIPDAQVTLTDSGGIVRTGSTDGAGYYRLDIKGLRPPFIVKVKRADGSEWSSASNSAVLTRGFVPININGLTDKTLGYVADALNVGGGAAAAVSSGELSANLALLDQARAKLRAGLAVPLVNAGFDPASYDPVTTPLVQGGADRHAALLRGIRFTRSAAGRTTVVATIAGNARPFDVDDVAVDGAGNLYVADRTANSIYKVDPAGVVTLLAGSGAPGFADGAGAAASFYIPGAIALDADGNLYVADALNHAIRKVTPAGVVTTLAGGAGRGFVDGVGSAAKFYVPGTIAVDRGGNVYVTDANFAVRRITPAAVVTTIAGYSPQGPYTAGTNPATTPNGIAVDSAGNLYYGDVDYRSPTRRRIVKITPAGVATDLYQAPAGNFLSPSALAVDATGTVYVADRTMVVRITAAGEARTLAGAGYGSADGNGASARFTPIGGIAIGADGNLFIADRANASVRKITPAGDVTTVLGKRPGGFADGPAASALFSGDYWLAAPILLQFTGMGGVAVDSAGDIFLADTGNHAIRRIARSGMVTTVAGNGAPGFANGNGRAASFNAPTSLALDGNGNIYVADTRNGAVRKISPSGDVSTLASGLSGPSHVAVGRDAVVYVSDGGVAVRRIDAAGVVSTLTEANASNGYADGFFQLGPIAIDADGTVLVKAASNHDIFAISGDGARQRLTNFQPPWITPANSLAVDGSGNLYYLLWYVADGSMGKLVRRSSALVSADIALDAIPQLFDYLSGHIAVDGHGNIVVVDAPSCAIRIVLP